MPRPSALAALAALGGTVLVLALAGLVAGPPPTSRSAPAGAATIPSRPSPADLPAVPTPTRPEDVASRPEPLRPFGAPPVDLDSAPPLAKPTLPEATQKLIDKLAKQIDKGETKIGKLQDKQADQQDALADQQDAVADVQATLDIVEGLLVVAQGDLADALALPEDTPEQLATKEAAVAYAEQGVALAEKEVALYEKQLAKQQKQADKLQAKIDKLEDKQADQQDAVDGFEAETAVLQTPFDYRTAEEVPFALQVLAAGGGTVAGARVLVLDALNPPKGNKPLEQGTSGAVWWQGFTDAGGSCDAVLRLPPDRLSLDVVIVAPGFTGPYEHEELREHWGPCAPAARITAERAELADAQIVLTAET